MLPAAELKALVLQQGGRELSPFGIKPSIWKRNWEEGIQEGRAELGVKQKLPCHCHCHSTRSPAGEHLSSTYLLVLSSSSASVLTSPFYPNPPLPLIDTSPSRESDPLGGCFYYFLCSGDPSLFPLLSVSPHLYQPVYPVRVGSFLCINHSANI